MEPRYGIIFDVDGVIADTEGVNARASIQMFEELFSLPGVKRTDFDAGIGRGAEAYVRAAAEVHGLDLSDEQVELATRARQANFLKILEAEPLPAFPGVRELISKAMAQADTRVGIATSSTRAKSEAVLRSAEIPYDDMVYVTGDQVTHKKPHPELFLTAAARMELTPDRCVVIEDAPNGVEAAKAAGCRCIGVTNTTTPDALAPADRVVDSLALINVATVVEMIDGPKGD